MKRCTNNELYLCKSIITADWAYNFPFTKPSNIINYTSSYVPHRECLNAVSSMFSDLTQKMLLSSESMSTKRRDDIPFYMPHLPLVYAFIRLCQFLLVPHFQFSPRSSLSLVTPVTNRRAGLAQSRQHTPVI